MLLIKKYAAPAASDLAVDDIAADDTDSETILEMQDDKNVEDELKKRTPQDFFQSSLPDRIEEIATEHVKDVLTYISNRGSDLEGFEVGLHSLQYLKHEAPKVIGPQIPESSELQGPPRATISAILEIKSSGLQAGHNKKFALAVFFVNSNGAVTTSDSVKGEDDIIYGFTTEGLTQYFSRTKGEVE